MLNSRHLVIADKFSRKQLNPGQTLIANPLYNGHFYGGHSLQRTLFLGKVLSFALNLPLYNGHTNFWVNQEIIIKQVRDSKNFFKVNKQISQVISRIFQL